MKLFKCRYSIYLHICQRRFLLSVRAIQKDFIGKVRHKCWLGFQYIEEDKMVFYDIT